PPPLKQTAGFRNHRFAGQERRRQSAKSLHRPGVVPVTRANHSDERSGIDQDIAQDFPNLCKCRGWLAYSFGPPLTMPHTSLTKSKADTLGLFLRKAAASASRTTCDFGTRRCRAVASRCALILSGILQVIVVMPFDNTELHIEQYLNHLVVVHF